MPTNLDYPPQLSIVVAARNAGQFIGACLSSIAVQMDGTHELLVIDDGSRDGTADVASALRDAHPGCAIRVIHQPAGGVARARNRGLCEARGRYIQFVDADDLLLPGALAAIGAVIAAHAPDVVACDFRTWRPERGGRVEPVELGYPAGTLCTDRDGILRAFFADRHMYVWANVIRRDLY
ncbi:MAG TPA: glycosyltransferase, partial [Telluria sp.]|nr:glycosyltransferase [Telluria sp.]